MKETEDGQMENVVADPGVMPEDVLLLLDVFETDAFATTA